MRPQATLWLLDLAATDADTLAQGLDSLGASVQQRFHRFLRPERQRQFLAGRLLLRRALADACPDVQTTDIQFTERAGAAPLASMPGGAPFFSISHAGNWVACAVCTAAPLGLDIEVSGRRRDFAALAEHSFDAATAQRLASLPDAERAAAFYREWCRLEAEFKLGRPATHWLQIGHAELTIAIASREELELLLLQA